MEQLLLPGGSGFFRIDSEEGHAAEFVLIPGTMFEMGDTFHEGRADELPVYELYLPAYWMGRTEVSKALWDEVRSWAGSHGYTDLPTGFAKGSDHPVGSISWHAAVKWCNARSEREGLNPCYLTNGFVYRTGTFKKALCYLSNGGYRLPTEAEWERAARGGVRGHRFPWSDSDLITHERANYYSTNTLAYDVSVTAGFHPDFIQDPMPYTNPVGSFPANGLGLHDMAGNVFEWCGDWYDSYPSNQGGPASGDFRIYRGGAWGAYASTARCAYREPLSPTLTSPASGSAWPGRSPRTHPGSLP